jgi:hypothetical protein
VLARLPEGRDRWPCAREVSGEWGIMSQCPTARSDWRHGRTPSRAFRCRLRTQRRAEPGFPQSDLQLGEPDMGQAPMLTLVIPIYQNVEGRAMTAVSRSATGTRKQIPAVSVSCDIDHLQRGT